jgi:hypothetical protein
LIGRFFVAAAAAFLSLAAPASGALLKGTVTGSPYVASGASTAVPVTFSKQTAARAGLRSPVGVIVVPRRRMVPTPDGPVRPTALRLGDRFRFSSSVPAAARAAVYTRLATSRLSVYKRSRTLTNDELTTQLMALTKYVGVLQDGVGAALARGGADVTVLASTVAVVQKTLADLLAKLAATGVTLPPEATAALATVQQQLASVTGALAGAAPAAGTGPSGLVGAVTGALATVAPR